MSIRNLLYFWYMSKMKDLGQVFTPVWVVDLILDKAGYRREGILTKKILEPACGDGVFLGRIVERYIKEAKKKRWSKSKIKKEAESLIVGLEVDEEVLRVCRNRLDVVAGQFGITNVRWSLHNMDALAYKDTGEVFDFVVGNPPYIRIHNLDVSVRKVLKERYSFCRNGMIDIYLAFFELGLCVMKRSGVLVYITPNMFLRNASNRDFRNYLINNTLLTDLIDFGSNQVFENANTYNCITKLKKSNKGTNINFFLGSVGSIEKVNVIDVSEYEDKKFIFASKEDIDFVNKKQSGKKIEEVATVQYGFATLRDRIYVSTEISESDTAVSLFDTDRVYEDNTLFRFNGELVEKSLLRDVVKGSRMFKDGAVHKMKILFPYVQNGSRWVVIPEKDMKASFPYAYRYFLKHREELEKRDVDSGALWYEYGRSQGVQSIHSDKIVVDMLVNGKINLEMVDKDTMVYSGIFITADKSWLSKIKRELESEDFFRYARLLGKDMQGAYKSISSNIIKQYAI